MGTRHSPNGVQCSGTQLFLIFPTKLFTVNIFLIFIRSLKYEYIFLVHANKESIYFLSQQRSFFTWNGITFLFKKNVTPKIAV